MITPIQEFHLRLIEDVVFAGFDGRAVAEGLRSYAELWHGVVLYNTYYQNSLPGATETIPEEFWEPGQLWIVVSDQDAAERVIVLCRELWGTDNISMCFLGSDWAKAYFGLEADALLYVWAWWDADPSSISLPTLMLRSRRLDSGRLSEEIARVQELHLQLIECIRFNSFNGKCVADGLRQHRDLWVGVIAADSHQQHFGMRLFDKVPNDAWRPNTLWIMAEDLASAQRLMELCREQWEADEAEFFTSQQARGVIRTDLLDDEVLVRVWWD